MEPATTQGAAAALGQVQDRFEQRWATALARFESNQILLEATAGALGPEEIKRRRKSALAELIQEWNAAIDEGHSAAYAAGRSFWGPQGGAPDANSLRRYLKRQKLFAMRFAVDLARGVISAPGRMSPGNRSALYTKALEGTFQQATVDTHPPGYRIYWRLGACEHCDDCPALAISSPYTQETLPTVPRSGETQCRTNCCCYLEYRPIQQRQSASDPSLRLGGSTSSPLNRALGTPPPPPPGRRHPTPGELRQIRDLEMRINHARRKAAHASTDAERRQWLRQRQSVNARLNKLLKDNGIHHTPTFSVGEVITARDITGPQVDNLVHARGIDGTTIHRAQSKAVQGALDEANKRLAEMLGGLPPTLPAVPDFEGLLKAAGAPASAFGGRLGQESAPAHDHHHGAHCCATHSCESVERQDTLPDPSREITVQLVAPGAAAALEAHLGLLEQLVEVERPVEVGPMSDRWDELVLALGSWIRGPAHEVEALVAGLSTDVAAARWQERG
ncbi:MAG: hypothetical protein ACE366_16695 [Bradymonadia bacterium]